MKKYQCNKCEGKEMFIMQKGCQIGLYCSECGAWQKWLSKKELPLAENYIKSYNNDTKNFN